MTMIKEEMEIDRFVKQVNKKTSAVERIFKSRKRIANELEEMFHDQLIHMVNSYVKFKRYETDENDTYAKITGIDVGGNYASDPTFHVNIRFTAMNTLGGSNALFYAEHGAKTFMFMNGEFTKESYDNMVTFFTTITEDEFKNNAYDMFEKKLNEEILTDVPT